MLGEKAYMNVAHMVSDFLILSSVPGELGCTTRSKCVPGGGCWFTQGASVAFFGSQFLNWMAGKQMFVIFILFNL